MMARVTVAPGKTIGRGKAITLVSAVEVARVRSTVIDRVANYGAGAAGGCNS